MPNREKVNVAILAGRRPQGDPVSEMFGVPYKAAAILGGRRMLSRVIDAIDASGRAANIYILLQTPEDLIGYEDFAPLAQRADVHFVRSTGSICNSLIDLVDRLGDDSWPLLVSTADHVFLEGGDIDAFLEGSPDDADITVGMIEDTTVLAEHPTARRTWLKFKDGAYTTCNLFLMNGPDARNALSFWSEVERHRKHPMKLAMRFGPVLTLLFFLRMLGLERALSRASRVVGAVARPVILHRANLSIDVDKPADVDLVRALLEG